MSTDGHYIFRKIGSTGLVIFERDGLLLPRSRPLSDLMLRDIDEELIQLLKKLRELNVRFGFISDQRGMDAGSNGRSEFVVLTRILDQLLGIRGALPDFWMARGGSPQRRRAEFQYRNDQGPMSDADMVSRAMKWYDVNKDKTIIVGSSEADLLTGNDADIACIRYCNEHRGRTYPTDVAANARRCASLQDTTDISRLTAAIGQILASGRSGKA